MAHARCNLMGGRIADEDLAVPGRRYGAGAVIRPRPGADDRAVADPAGGFRGHAARRRCSCEIATPVSSHRADRAVLARLVLVILPALAHGQGFLEGIPALLGVEVGGLLEGKTLPAAEFQSAVSNEQDMAGLL